MSFTVFDDELVSEVSNQLRLKSFNFKTLQILREANEQRKQLAQLTAPLSSLSMKQLSKKLVKSVYRIDKVNFKKYLNDFLADRKNYDQHDYYLLMQKWLNSDVWNQWQELEIESRRKIEKLHKFWLKNQKTNHFTSNAIFVAAEHLLLVFESFHQMAKIEIKYNAAKLTPSLVAKLKNSLKQTEKEIRAEQILLSDAMLSRLKIASLSGDLRSDDVTAHLIMQLRGVGVEVKQSLACDRRGLSPELFHYFHHFIANKGAVEQRKKLLSLEWLREDDQYFVQKIDESMVAIPRAFKKFRIPHKTSSFSLLFKWPNYRANFFKNKFYQISAARLLPNNRALRQSGLLDLLQGPQLQELNQLERDWFLEIQRAKQSRQSIWNRVFYSEKCQFMQEWQTYAEQNLQKILKRKIVHASLLADQLKTRLFLNLDLDVIAAVENKQVLQDMIDSTESLMKCCHCLPDNDQEWLKAKETLFKVINKSFGANVKPLSSSSTSIINALQHSQCEASVLIDVAHKMRDKVDNCCENGVLNPNLSQFLVNITQLHQLVQEPINPGDVQHMFWKNLLGHYIKASLAYPGHKNLTVLFELIMNHAPEFVQNNARDLDKLSHRHDSLYHTKCRALLFALERSGVEQCLATIAVAETRVTLSQGSA